MNFFHWWCYYHCTPMLVGISRLNKTPERNFAVETLFWNNSHMLLLVFKLNVFCHAAYSPVSKCFIKWRVCPVNFETYKQMELGCILYNIDSSCLFVTLLVSSSWWCINALLSTRLYCSCTSILGCGVVVIIVCWMLSLPHLSSRSLCYRQWNMVWVKKVAP